MSASSGPRAVDRATSTFLGPTSLWLASTTISGSWTTAANQAMRCGTWTIFIDLSARHCDGLW